MYHCAGPSRQDRNSRRYRRGRHSGRQLTGRSFDTCCRILCVSGCWHIGQLKSYYKLTLFRSKTPEIKAWQSQWAADWLTDVLTLTNTAFHFVVYLLHKVKTISQTLIYLQKKSHL